MTISSGVVHDLPADLKSAIASDRRALAAWEDITPLARNEWIVGLNQPRKQKPEAPASRGAVQVLRMANDARVVGPIATIADSK
jgi:hypothetical protein